MKNKSSSSSTNVENSSLTFFPKSTSPRCREAEDIVKSQRPPLSRQRSLPKLKPDQNPLTLQDDLANKSGAMWVCIGRHQDSFGGFIYTMKLKSDYDDFTPHPDRTKKKQAAEEKINEIFPAVEPLAEEVYIYNWDIPDDKMYEYLFNLKMKLLPPEQRAILTSTPERYQAFITQAKPELEWQIQQARILGLLGYRSIFTSEGVSITLPDREALLARWAKLREHVAGLPELNIISSSGVASDLAFVEAFLMADALLSTGIEITHDSFEHIIPMLEQMIDSAVGVDSTYQEERTRLVKMVATGYRRFMITKSMLDDKINFKIDLTEDELLLLYKNLDKIEAALGSAVDTILAASTYSMTSKLFDNGFLNRHIKGIWDKKSWAGYWNKRFGTENIDKILISNLWDQMAKIEDNFDQSRAQVPQIK